MKDARNRERASLTQSGGNRVQSRLTVERNVLERVQHVESRDPGHHGSGENGKHPPWLAPRSSDGQVAADGRDPEADPQHEVRPTRKALGVAVTEHPGESHGC